MVEDETASELTRAEWTTWDKSHAVRGFVTGNLSIGTYQHGALGGGGPACGTISWSEHWQFCHVTFRKVGPAVRPPSLAFQNSMERRLEPALGRKEQHNENVARIQDKYFKKTELRKQLNIETRNASRRNPAAGFPAPIKTDLVPGQAAAHGGVLPSMCPVVPAELAPT